jgi:hypothetical protein
MTAGNTTNGTTQMTNSQKPGKPWWRPLVDGIDRRVTPPANNLVRTNLFADTVATMTRLEVRLRRRIERQSSWLLHQYNLPTATDIRKMRAQLAAVEARLRDMGERLEDQQQASASERPANARRPKSATAASKATPK